MIRSTRLRLAFLSAFRPHLTAAGVISLACLSQAHAGPWWGTRGGRKAASSPPRSVAPAMLPAGVDRHAQPIVAALDEEPRDGTVVLVRGRQARAQRPAGSPAAPAAPPQTVIVPYAAPGSYAPGGYTQQGQPQQQFIQQPFTTQQYAPPQQSFGPQQPQFVAQPGYAPQNQGYASSPQGYGAPQLQGYGGAPQYAPQSSSGYGGAPQSYGYGAAPQPQGYGAAPQFMQQAPQQYSTQPAFVQSPGFAGPQGNAGASGKQGPPQGMSAVQWELQRIYAENGQEMPELMRTPAGRAPMQQPMMQGPAFSQQPTMVLQPGSPQGAQSSGYGQSSTAPSWGAAGQPAMTQQSMPHSGMAQGAGQTSIVRPVTSPAMAEPKPKKGFFSWLPGFKSNEEEAPPVEPRPYSPVIQPRTAQGGFAQGPVAAQAQQPQQFAPYPAGSDAPMIYPGPGMAMQPGAPMINPAPRQGEELPLFDLSSSGDEAVDSDELLELDLGQQPSQTNAPRSFPGPAFGEAGEATGDAAVVDDAPAKSPETSEASESPYTGIKLDANPFADQTGPGTKSRAPQSLNALDAAPLVEGDLAPHPSRDDQDRGRELLDTFLKDSESAAPPKSWEDAAPASLQAQAREAMLADRAGRPGLKGFCIVRLRDDRDLIDAESDFRAEFDGKIYHFSSMQALQKFLGAPLKYAPAARGADVVHYAHTGVEEEGSLDHAAWYQGRLYLFTSSETMETFVSSPTSYSVSQ